MSRARLVITARLHPWTQDPVAVAVGRRSRGGRLDSAEARTGDGLRSRVARVDQPADATDEGSMI